MMKQVQTFTVACTLAAFQLLLTAGCGGSAPAQTGFGNVSLVTIDDGEQAIEAGNYKEASDIFSKLILDSPNDPVLHYYLGLSKDNLGDASGAVASYRKALSLNGSLTNARLNLGLVYFRQGNLSAAIGEFENVVQAEPAAADAQYNLAMALAAAGKTDEAKARYEKCASLDPDDPDPLIALGTMAKDEGDTEDALALFEKAETLGTGSTAAALSIAQLYEEQKKTDAAIQKLMAISEMDADADTLASAGLMLAKLGQADGAITLYRHALEVSPDSSKVLLLLGNALARNKKYGDAAVYFEKIIHIAPDSPEAGAAQKGLAACKAKLTP